MVGPSVGAVDHRIGGALELIVQTARYEPPDDRPGRVARFERIVADAAFDPQLGKPVVDALDDIVVLAERPQGGLGAFGEIPPARP
jgi:hypothetical protein